MKNVNIKRIIDRTLSKSIYHQIALVLVVAILLFGILVGIQTIFKCSAHTDYCDWILHFINPANSFTTTMDMQEKDKLWALIVGFLGMVVLSGFLISVFNNIIARRVEKIQNGQVQYRISSHYVIIGFNRMTANVIRQICNKDKTKNYILIQTAQKVKEVRRILEVDLNRKEMNRVILMHGAGNSDEDLGSLYIQHAEHVIVLGDDTTEAHDAQNMECMKRIVFRLKDEKCATKLRCDVLFNNQSTFAILQRVKISKDWSDVVNFRPFDFHETWAQKVIVSNETVSEDSKIKYTPLDRDGINYDSNKNVHFVIAGMNKMGIALGIEAA